jgi:putative phosphoesterase
MKVGIISDTHRNKELLQTAVEWLVNRQKISALYHLGDDVDDIKVLEDYNVDILQVPGLYDERYKNGSLPAKIQETIFGISLLLIHSTEKDLTDGDVATADIILHGHTHHQELRLADGKLFINPGHLKGPIDKNMPATFALLTIQEHDVVAEIYDMKFKPVHTMHLIRSESGLYKSE